MIAGVPIAGIGASAGGIDALRRLLQNAHAGSSIVLMIVQHLIRPAKALGLTFLAAELTCR
jgi:chemotaxis response regulator CheB